MCVGILLHSLTKWGGEPVVHQLCLPSGRKGRSTQKKTQPTHEVSSSHPEPFLLLFYHSLYCCPGQSLKLWIFFFFGRCFPKSSAHRWQDGEHVSALRFNIVQMPEPAHSTLQAPSTSGWEWHLPSSSSIPTHTYYGLVQLFLESFRSFFQKAQLLWRPAPPTSTSQRAP